jgi:hypothetical protein
MLKEVNKAEELADWLRHCLDRKIMYSQARIDMVVKTHHGAAERIVQYCEGKL